MQATGKKPAWETGASMALPRRAPAAKAQSKAPAKAAWSLPPDDDGELLDDSELLTEEDLQRPSVPSKALICAWQFRLGVPYCLSEPRVLRQSSLSMGMGMGMGMLQMGLQGGVSLSHECSRGQMR